MCVGMVVVVIIQCRVRHILRTQRMVDDRRVVGMVGGWCHCDQTRSSHNSQQSDKEAGGGHHKGMSPEVKDGLGRWDEQSEEEGYHENMGWGHMQGRRHFISRHFSLL